MVFYSDEKNNCNTPNAPPKTNLPCGLSNLNKNVIKCRYCLYASEIHFGINPHTGNNAWGELITCTNKIVKEARLNETLYSDIWWFCKHYQGNDFYFLMKKAIKKSKKEDKR